MVVGSFCGRLIVRPEVTRLIVNDFQRPRLITDRSFGCKKSLRIVIPKRDFVARGTASATMLALVSDDK